MDSLHTVKLTNVSAVVLWFIIRNILGLPPAPDTELQKISKFLSGESRSVFCYVDGVTLEPYLRVGASCKENQPCD